MDIDPLTTDATDDNSSLLPPPPSSSGRGRGRGRGRGGSASSSGSTSRHKPPSSSSSSTSTSNSKPQSLSIDTRMANTASGSPSLASATPRGGRGSKASKATGDLQTPLSAAASLPPPTPRSRRASSTRSAGTPAPTIHQSAQPFANEKDGMSAIADDGELSDVDDALLEDDEGDKKPSADHGGEDDEVEGMEVESSGPRGGAGGRGRGRGSGRGGRGRGGKRKTSAPVSTSTSRPPHSSSRESPVDENGDMNGVGEDKEEEEDGKRSSRRRKSVNGTSSNGNGVGSGSTVRGGKPTSSSGRGGKRKTRGGGAGRAGGAGAGASSGGEEEFGGKGKGRERGAGVAGNENGLDWDGGLEDGIGGGDGADDEGETKCVCGENNDDSNAVLMIQCESCKCWQHGPCVGLENEKDCPDSYYCRDCRPDLHPMGTLARKTSHKGEFHLRHSNRSSSMESNDRSHVSTPTGEDDLNPGNTKPKERKDRERERIAREQREQALYPPTSHFAPALAPKRRSTMNSRDAAYDQEALATAIAASHSDSGGPLVPGAVGSGGVAVPVAGKERIGTRRMGSSDSKSESGRVGLRSLKEEREEEVEDDRLNSKGEEDDGGEYKESLLGGGAAGAGGAGKLSRRGVGGRKRKRGGAHVGFGEGEGSVTAGSPAHSVTASNHEDGHLEIPRSAKRRKTSPEGNEVDVHEKVPEPIGTGPVSEVSPDVSNANLSRAASAAVEPVAQVTSARKRGHKRDLPADEDEVLPQPTTTRTKHANQWTNRSREGGTGRTRGSPHKRGNHGGVDGRRRDFTPSDAGWGLPDHLSHLSHLLPSANPVPLSIPSYAVGPPPPVAQSPNEKGKGRRTDPDRDRERDASSALPVPVTTVTTVNGSEVVQEAPTRIRFPTKRATMPEMKKRANSILEYLTKVQVEMAAREKKQKVLGTNGNTGPLSTGESGSTSTSTPPPTSSVPSPSANPSSSNQGTTRGQPQAASNNGNNGSSPTMTAMDDLTRELILFKARFFPDGEGGQQGQSNAHTRISLQRPGRGRASRAASHLSRSVQAA